jgi:nicotinamide-nucleotide amidase
MSATNEKQADLIDGARALRNPRGTAPGQILEMGGRVLVLLPGPPGEMKPMFDEQVVPFLRARVGPTRVVHRRVLRIAAMPESEVDQVAAPVYSRFDDVTTTILGAAGQIELHLVAQGDGVEDAAARIERLAAALREALPGRIFSEDGRELPHVVVDLLRERGLRLALAESCTGGLLSARLTEVPGASAVLERAFVTYANQAKVEEIGVDPALLQRQGAVSEETASAMAEGAMRAARVDVGVGITGIAGPDGGTPEKPVGLVFVATCGAAGARVRRSIFPGGRERVRFQATQVALEMLRRGLLGLAPL